MQNTQPSTQVMAADAAEPGRWMHQLASRLFPIHRSMSGEGNRETLRVLNEYVPVKIHEVPTGTPVFDWTVPREWSIRDAYVADDQGRRIIDYRQSNLQIVNGSNPLRARMTWAELKPRIHTLPEHPDWIPYRTDFFTDGWGFCMSQRAFDHADGQVGDRQLEVVIDASYADGSLTYGEVFLPGKTDRELLLYAHLCHPSLANDNLSGIVIATRLARELASAERYYSVRIVFAPATLGAITWLAINEANLSRIDHGLILTLLGDRAPLSYKRSRRAHAVVDRAAEYLHEAGTIGSLHEFSPLGYDERQFCSPGIDLPMGRLMRSEHGQFDQYHSSGDDLDFITPRALEESLDACRSLIHILENNRTYQNRKPKGEPQLGEYGIYRAFGKADDRGQLQEAILWLLNLTDGTNDLLSISRRSGLPFDLLDRAAKLLLSHDLIVHSEESYDDCHIL